MTDLLLIDNHGPLIISTNWWATEHAKRGLLYATTNAGCFRLLIPKQHESIVEEIKTAKLVIISRGPWPDAGKAEALEILADDGTDEPWSCHLSPGQYDRVPEDKDTFGEWIFAAYTRPRRNISRPHKAIERPARYRFVSRLPCLEPWGEMKT